VARDPAALPATCGVPGLDAALGGLLRGDNLLWTVDGPRAADPFYRAVTQAGQSCDPMVYVTVTDPPAAVAARLPHATVIDARPGHPLTETVALLHHLDRRVGRGGRALVLLDPLESLAARWGHDQAGRFVARCMLLLLDRDAIGYWSARADLAPTRLYRHSESLAQCSLVVDQHVIRVTKAEGHPVEALGTMFSYELRHGLPTGVTLAPLTRRVAAALRNVRQQRGLTQHQLGELADVSASAISQAERGHRGLSLATMLALTQRLGISIEQLLGPGSAPPGYRVGRRRPAVTGRPILHTLLDADHGARTMSVVHLPAGRSLTPELPATYDLALIVAEGLVEVTTPDSRTVLRTGDAMSTPPSGLPLTALRDLGPGSTIFLIA
jgi:DNA-binding XRE family transcriptional regulator